MNKILLAITLALPLLVSSTARADQPTEGRRRIEKEDREDCARAKAAGKSCYMDFGKGDDVGGDKPVATGSDINTIMGAMFGNLIRHRVDFRPEIIRTADRL